MPSLLDVRPDECERLLRSQHVGRFALSTPDGLEIVPVNYAVRDGAVRAHTAADGILARFGHGQELVFQVDLLDHERWSGWSVIARGTGVVGELDRDDVVPLGARPRPWAAGERNHEIRLEWDQLTGRRLGGPIRGVTR